MAECCSPAQPLGQPSKWTEECPHRLVRQQGLLLPTSATFFPPPLFSRHHGSASSFPQSFFPGSSSNHLLELAFAYELLAGSVSLFPLLANSNIGTIARTGNFKKSSTSLSVCMDLSISAIKYSNPIPRTNPPPNPPPVKYDFFGKEGFSGRLGGSSTRNCSLCCWCSRSVAIADCSCFFNNSL